MVDELAGPLSYSPGWWWVLIALLVLPALAAIAIRLPGWIRKLSHRPGSGDSLRTRSLTVIAAIERRHEDGQLTAREAHSELSQAVREFVSRRSPVPVDVMTLADLERVGTEEKLLAAVRAFYDGAFDPNPKSEVSNSARIAREVVAEWN